MKNFLKASLLVMFSIIISLVLGEILLRIIAPQRLDNNLALYVADDTLVFRMKENYSGIYASSEFEVPVKISSIGLRNEEIEPKAPNTLRILGLGDSFTFGNGVTMEQTYLYQLERCLPTYNSRRTEVINGGVPAYSPLQESRFLKTQGMKLAPDIVVMGFFVGNDFVESGDYFDSSGAPTLSVKDGSLKSTKGGDGERGIVRSITSPFRSFLSTRSHLYVFLRDRSSQLLSKFGLRPFNLPPEFCEVEFSARMTERWSGTQSVLTDLAHFTKQNGQRFIVVILPAIYQVYSSSWNEYITALKLDPNRYDLDKPQKLLADFFTARGIEFVDALPLLRAHAKDATLCFPVDGHLTAEGHQVVAQALCSYLNSEKLRTGQEQPILSSGASH